MEINNILLTEIIVVSLIDEEILSVIKLKVCLTQLLLSELHCLGPIEGKTSGRYEIKIQFNAFLSFQQKLCKQMVLHNQI